MGNVFNYNLDRMQEALSGVVVSVEEARKSHEEFKEGGDGKEIRA